jgi:hypothetical protein
MHIKYKLGGREAACGTAFLKNVVLRGTGNSISKSQHDENKCVGRRILGNLLSMGIIGMH